MIVLCAFASKAKQLLSPALIDHGNSYLTSQASVPNINSGKARLLSLEPVGTLHKVKLLVLLDLAILAVPPLLKSNESLYQQ